MIDVGKQVFTIAITILYLTCFHSISQAQEQAPTWQAIDIATSVNGRYLAVQYGLQATESPNENTEIWLYDLEDLLLSPQYLAGDIYRGAKMTFSPNDQYLAVGNVNELSIIDIEDGAIILDLQRTSMSPSTDFGWISFSPDSNYFISFSDWWALEQKMSIWDVHTGQRIHAIDAQRGRRWVYYSWLSPDWTQYARWSGPNYYGNDTIIYEFDIDEGLGQPLARLSKNGRTGVFSTDGSLFAVAIEEVSVGEAVKVHIYETDTWTLKTSQETSAHVCEADIRLRFSHDNSVLLFVYECLFDNWASVWSLATDELVFQAKDHPYSPVAFAVNGEFLLGRGKSGNAVWSIKKSFELTEYPGGAAALHADSDLMATIGPDGKVWIWNIKSKQLLIILPAPRH